MISDHAADDVPGDDRWSTRSIVLVGLLGAWGMAALVASQTYLAMHDHGHSWWRLFLWQAAGWSVWGLAVPAILRLGAREPHPSQRLEPRRWLARRAMPHLLFAVSLAMLQPAAAAVAAVALQPFEPVASYRFVEHLLRLLRTGWPIAFLLYGALALGGFAIAASTRRRHATLRASRLETELARAQLEALRLELQPHFLFNTLNAIAALIRRRSNDGALEMVLGLSQLLRLTLERSRRPFVTLSEELDLIERYVELQRARFADRLAVEVEVEPGCELGLVPTMLLQPLVENAIRHGVAPRARGGRISIIARREADGVSQRDSRWSLAVVDDGVGLASGLDLGGTAGVGLSNTRSRLRQLYGELARLEVHAREGGGVEARIVLPFQCEGASTFPRAVAG